MEYLHLVLLTCNSFNWAEFDCLAASVAAEIQPGEYKTTWNF